jgi:YHS domain-containing protein
MKFNSIAFAGLGSALLLLFAGGCATTSTVAQRGLGEVCHVCEYNNDLACVCVTVDATTPRADYQGQTYYFCSEDCKSAFLKKPDKYLRRR